MHRVCGNCGRAVWPVLLASLMVLAISSGPALAQAGNYLGPQEVMASPDGGTLFVLNQDAKQVAVVDLAAGKVTRTMALPATPTGIAASKDGAKLFVTCAAPAGSVVVLEAASGKQLAVIAAGHGACAPCPLPDGRRLYVCNRFQNSVSVIDLEAGKEVGRVAVVREPIASAATPDGKTVLVTNHLPLDPADSFDVASVVSAINTADHSVEHIRLLNGSSSVRGVCVSPDGKYAYAVHILARYQMPTTQLERGWMNTNAMSIIDVEAKKLVNAVLLDDVDLGAANPWDIECTADGKYLCVSHAGTHEVTVIDRAMMHETLAAVPADDETARAQGRYDDRNTYSSAVQADVPNDLAFLVDLKQRIRIQGRGPWGWQGADRTEANSPRGIAIVGSKIYVCAYFSDRLAVIDLQAHPARQVSYIDLGPKPELTQQRWGELNFYDAWLCFQHWQSCASCHPDARADGLNWDLMNDGLGNPKNARSMLLAHQTPPSMASGVRATAEEAVRAGFTHILFTVQPEEVTTAIDEYLKALQPLPSPYLVDGRLSEAAERGKALFFSERVGCATCHPEPLYTDLQMHDVGSRGPYDRRDDFDTPTLIECWRTAPYMHDGHFTTVKDLIAVGKHGKKGGDVEGLTEQEIKDLVEFVLSL